MTQGTVCLYKYMQERKGQLVKSSVFIVCARNQSGFESSVDIAVIALANQRTQRANEPIMHGARSS